MSKMVFRLKPPERNALPRGRWRLRVWRMVQRPAFERGMMLVIILNVGMLAATWYDEPEMSINIQVGGRVSPFPPHQSTVPSCISCTLLTATLHSILHILAPRCLHLWPSYHLHNLLRRVGCRFPAQAFPLQPPPTRTLACRCMPVTRARSSFATPCTFRSPT